MTSRHFFSDSESVYDGIIGDICKSHGKEYAESVRLKILGRTEQDTAKIVVGDMQLPLSCNEFLCTYRNKCEEKFQIVQLMPGARQLVRYLYDNNIPIAVATSSAQEEMELKTRLLKDVFGLFTHIVCGSTDPDVKHGKPAPDIFLVCASRFPDKPDPSTVSYMKNETNTPIGIFSEIV